MLFKYWNNSFKALFDRKPSFGLSNLGIQSELALKIHDEADMEKVIHEIKNPDRSYTELNSTNIISSETVPDYALIPVNEVALPFQPLPEGSHVFSSILSCYTTITTNESNSSFIPTSSRAGEMNCISCGLQTSGAHKCPKWYRSIHFICGRPAGEERYGSSVWCPRCDLEVKVDT